jgi:hypothetical protein
MYPGSFIWRRIGDKWLVSKSAAAGFAVAAIIILGMTVAIITTEPQTIGSVVRFFLGIGGILAAVSVFFLWGGMWHYWERSDSSSLAARRAWFFGLVFGLWYGAVLYYLLVYLPNTLDAMHTRSSQQ